MKRGLIILSIMITFIFGGPIEFAGNASIYTEYNPVTGALQERPTSTLRFNLNPSLNIYGMPSTCTPLFWTKRGLIST